MMDRRGTSLAELLVVLATAAVVAAMVVPLLGAASRAVVVADRRLASERDALALTALLGASLAPSGVDDLNVVPGGEQLEFDRQVGRGSACAVGPGTLTIDPASWRGVRDPEAGRDAVLLLASDSLRWQRARIVARSDGSCPGGGGGWLLTLDRPLGPGRRLRVVEPGRVRSYPSGAGWWLGLERRFGTGAIQPFAGPVAPGGLSAALAVDGRLRVELRWPGGGPSLRLDHLAAPRP